MPTKKKPSAPQEMQVERKFNPEKEAIQKAAMRDYTARMQPGQWVPLANGEQVRVSGYVGMKYPGEKVDHMLGRPQDMLLNPKPDYHGGHRYIWRVRTSPDARDIRPAETAALHRAQRIRYVEVQEVNPDSEIALYTPFTTTDGVYVTWQTNILCEIMDQRLAYEMYKGWEDLGIQRVMDLNENVYAEPGTHLGNKTGTKVEISNIKRGG